MSYAGVCVGGPYDGRKQVAPSPFIRLVIDSPELSFLDVGKEAFEVEVKVGTYVFDDGVWRWQT